MNSKLGFLFGLLLITNISSAYAVDVKVLVNFTSSAENRFSVNGATETVQSCGIIEQCTTVIKTVCDAISCTDVPVQQCSNVNKCEDSIIASALKMQIDDIFTSSNQRYSDSGINIRLIPVGYFKFDTEGNQDVRSGINLKEMRLDAAITNRRNQYKADFVTLFTFREKNTRTCGTAYKPDIDTAPVNSPGVEYINPDWSSYAYSQIGINCAGRTFAHELGHNFGLGHSPQQDALGSLYKYGTGHGVDGVFLTTMASGYAGATRGNFFSDPNLICDTSHLACGVANVSNAVLAVNKIAQYASELAENCTLSVGGWSCKNLMPLAK